MTANFRSPEGASCHIAAYEIVSLLENRTDEFRQFLSLTVFDRMRVGSICHRFAATLKTLPFLFSRKSKRRQLARHTVCPDWRLQLCTCYAPVNRYARQPHPLVNAHLRADDTASGMLFQVVTSCF